ncbi:uncharacterized protein LOC130625058 [Hydractinia symbiolongicarpus]|uniref:uncharacterized protein LOC130625058 n=1 Tax=Hydractinia symbiolongicarpus TaxID=13093 RepID=UPI00254A089E|nr:uncharacterized protein LOC130625058 [Hydractinia symbiolongicarpus]
MAPITWQSKKIKRVARSTLVAETLALVNGIDTCIWVKNVINKVLNTNLEGILCHTDNKSLFEAAHSTKSLEDKRVRVDMASLRQSINQKEIELKWISTKHQLADVLTKQGANSTLLMDVLQSGHEE